MFSRAHLLLTHEIDHFNRRKPWGISLEQVNESSTFEWCAKIHGYKRTMWQDGIFRVYIRFDENYNIRPPQVLFHTIPFHPNIDMITGKPCIDFLDDWTLWDKSHTVTFILLTLQNLLSNPIAQDAVNMEAAKMIMSAPSAYQTMVKDCVIASQRVEAGLPPMTGSIFTLSARLPRTAPPPQPVAMISFEDYHKQWVDLATSSPVVPSKQQMFTEFTQDDHGTSRGYTNLTNEEITKRKKAALKQHYTLVFGRNKTTSTQQDGIAEKLARINHMKQVYLPKSSPLTTPDGPVISPAFPMRESRDTSHAITVDPSDPFEKEVDELMAWTNSLNQQQIDV